jgi:hypothetical protein
MAITKHILSKSTFMYGCQCPLRLYNHKFRPNLRNPFNEEQQAIFTAGTTIGQLAQQVFPGGENAEPPDAFSFHLSVEKTQEMLKRGVKIIYEAAFNYNGILCAIDILVNKKGKWYAYEVKNVTRVKPPHILDASLQYYVITNSGIALEDISIMHLNTAYVKRGELNLQELFTATSVLEKVVIFQSFIKQKAAELMKMLQTKKEPEIEPGDHCFTPYGCDFTEHCWKNVEEEEADHGEHLVNKRAIKAFIKQFEYPLFFFDFETVAHPVPAYDESRPYQQVPFQYSLHIQKKPGAKLEHLAFLGDGESDPRKALTQELIKALGKKGSILVWYLPFENGRLTELARDFPAYKDAVSKIQARLIDLIIPFKQKHYTHPGFESSASIKNVLPVLVPELSYADLEIQDGGSASSIYAELKNQTKKIQAQQRKALLDYCHLDTLAMVRILEKLSNI